MTPVPARRAHRQRAGGRAVRASRVGVFGGTFDPPHYGHLALAEWARAELDLDQVLFVPAGLPPHKRRGEISPARHRVAMTRLAVRGNPAFAVSTLETRRSGPSFTADTVCALAAERQRSELHLLMGADMFATFDDWRRPEEIVSRAVLVIAMRPGVRRHQSRWSRRGRGVVWLDNPGFEVSSRALRERARAGLPLRYLVPEAVARYVIRHRLYRGRAGVTAAAGA